MLKFNVNENRPPKIGSLTVLKFMAMLLIIWWHFVGTKIGTFALGVRMVEFLFVAAGFLVGYNYYHKGMPDKISYCFKYLFNKLKKIYPLHILCIVLIIILNYKKYILGFTFYKFQILLVQVFLLQSWVPYIDATSYSEIVLENYNIVSWFLSGLMFCYLISPFLINLIKKKRSLILPLFFLVTIMMFWFDSDSKFGSGILCVPNTSVVYCALEYCMGMLMVPAFFTFKEKIPQRKVVNVLATILEVCLLILTYFVMKEFDADWWTHKTVFVLTFCITVFVFAFDLGYFSILCQKIALLGIADIQLEMYLLPSVVSGFVATLLGIFNLTLTIWPMFTLTVSVLLIVSITYKILIEGRVANLIDRLWYKLRGKLSDTKTTESAEQ